VLSYLVGVGHRRNALIVVDISVMNTASLAGRQAPATTRENPIPAGFVDSKSWASANTSAGLSGDEHPLAANGGQ